MRLIGRDCRDFLRDERGAAAGFEFAMFIPLMLAITVFAAEYANALMTKEAFESAVRDATRVLSRSAIVDCDGGFVAGGTPEVEPCLETFFDTLSAQMVAARVGLPPDRITFAATVRELGAEVGAIAAGEDPLELRTPYYIVQVSASAELDLPLLRLINSFTAQAANARGEVKLVQDFNSAMEANAVRAGTEADVPKPQDPQRTVPLFLEISANDSARWVGENRPGCDINIPLSCGGPK